MQYTHTNENGDEFIWDVNYTPSYYFPAKFSGDPDTWHEEESANIEINCVINSLGQAIVQTLDKKTIDDIKEACTEDMEMKSEY